MEPKTESVIDKLNNNIRNSVSIKLLSIGFLIAILLIPNSMIKSLIRERNMSQLEAVEEVSEKWGAPLELVGPIITVPFVKVVEDEQNNYRSKHFAHFLPENLEIKGNIAPDIRKRGIYEVMVYTSDLKLSGDFSQLDMSQFTDQPENILWDELTVSIGIPDMSGIESAINFNINEQTYRMEPGIPSTIGLDLGQQTSNHSYNVQKRSLNRQTGVNSTIAWNNEREKNEFGVDLKINGTKTILFNPIGKRTHVSIESTWEHPSFTGKFLPDEHTISSDGFRAEWSIFDLNRNYPQQWIGQAYSIQGADFGVNLYQPVDNYQQNTRSAKYAVLILFLTFITFFFVEILNKKRIHPIQYVLIGLALTVFYTLLLSLSEQIGFDAAYLISSGVIIAMISFYAKSILKSNRLAGVLFGFFSLIYAFIFVILQLEDFALLVGSIGLVMVLGCCMYLSRKIDWYNIKPKQLGHA